MITRTAFLERLPRVLPILLSVICLLASALAQHGGGGGHSGGGHGGGHSSSSGHSSVGHSSVGHSSGRHSNGSQTSGHSGWWHFGFGKHSRNAGFGATTTSDISAPRPSHLWNIPTAGNVPLTAKIPSTLLSSPLFPRHLDGHVLFTASPGRRRRGLFFNSYRRFSSSGCFYNGVTQVCFFEPFLPLLSCYGGFSLFYSGFDFGGDELDLGGNLNSQGPPQWEMSAIPPSANPSEDETAEGNSPERPAAALGAVTEGEALGKGLFLLVLNNGSSHAVTDYWVSDGYLEYISPDGTRSHIPLDALDLQRTVTENAPRGLPFVLRSTSAQNR